MCLCGSTRFYDQWQKANFDETLAGKIVLSVGFYPHAEDKAHAAHVGVTPKQKVALDELHKRKIDLADEVLILNVGGYVGESTHSEWEYAVAHGKRVRWLESEHALQMPRVPALPRPDDRMKHLRLPCTLDCPAVRRLEGTLHGFKPGSLDAHIYRISVKSHLWGPDGPVAWRIAMTRRRRRPESRTANDL